MVRVKCHKIYKMYKIYEKNETVNEKLNGNVFVYFGTLKCAKFKIRINIKKILERYIH